MSTGTVTAGRPSGVDWRRAEFVLTALAILSFALIPVHITTIYSGLPAHPLFLHVPVMLIPIAVIGAIAVVLKPVWFERYGVVLAIIAVVAMASLFLTMGAGEALRAALHLNGSFGPAELIQRHENAADKLRILDILFTAVVILGLGAHRIAAGKATGLAIVDRALGAPATIIGLRIVLVLLAIGCGYMVFKTGDLGAKAVWQGRLSGGGFGGGFRPGGTGGSGVSGLFTPGGG